MNIKIESMLFPWKRCLYNMKSNYYDAIIHLSKTEEREEYIIYSEPYLDDYDLVFYAARRETPIEWNTLEDFKPYTIGLVDGYGYTDELINVIKKYNLDVEKTITELQNYYKLIDGRIDFTIGAKAVALEYFKKYPILKKAIKTSKKPFRKFNWFLAFSKDSPAKVLLPEINKTIKEMKKDGTINKIKMKYNF